MGQTGAWQCPYKERRLLTCTMRLQVLRPNGAGPAGGRAILQQRRHDAHKLVKAHARVVVGIHLAWAGISGTACCCESVGIL